MKHLSSLVVAFAAFSCIVVTPARAQDHEPEAGLVALHQALLDARTDAIVLNVAAHPDDESSRTNTVLRRKYGCHVVTMYSTYGDGGQNAIGREIGPELASLRVRETLRAAGMSGVEVRWLGMPDFGFSKTLEETLKVWDGEVLKRRMRKVLDAVEPDLILTNHSLNQGHGHHRASYWAITELLKERAAQGKRVPPLYVRCGVEDAQWTVDPAELEPARGETYARLAHRAWTQHVTQGPWGPHNPLQVGKDFWKLGNPDLVVDPVPAEPGNPMRWVLPKALQLDRLAADAVRREPKELAGEAARLLAQAENEQSRLFGDGAASSGGQPWHLWLPLQNRIDALQRVLLALANVRDEVWLERDEVAVGGLGKVFVVIHGVDRVQGLVVKCGDTEAEPVQAAVRATPFDGMPAPPANTTPAPAAPEAAVPAEPKPAVVAPAPATVPGRYSVTFAPDSGPGDSVPEGPEPGFVYVSIRFQLDGVAIHMLPRLAYTPVPQIEVQWDREVVMVPKGQTVERLLSGNITSHRERSSEAAVRLSMGPGIQATTIPGRLTLSPEHQNARLLVRATIDANELTADAGMELGFRNQSSRIRVIPIEVSVPPGLKVGLVRGPDDTTERALADLGVAFVSLDRDALLMARFEEFTTVLLDIRAYHHWPELAEVRERLLQFVRAGGRVVAMYHKPGEWNERAGHPQLAPFPLTVADVRVTEEDSPVVMLQPEHRLWQHPHTITAADFGGWVQERGLNFPDKWDPAWTALLELKDSGDDKPRQGALLHTQYGRGDFVYCSLALYRQLRIGNAGAARLLVNLLAK